MALVIIFVLALLAIYVSGIERTKSISPEVRELFHQGFSLVRDKRYTEALEIYDFIINLLPDDPTAYAQRGNVYYYLGEIDKAIEDYSKAIELKPDFAEAYNNRGNAYLSKGEMERGVRDLTRAVELSPQLKEAFFQSGNSSLRRRKV